METPGSFPSQQWTRRSLLKTLAYGTVGTALYAGEVERHWIDVVHQDVFLSGLPADFHGMTVAQLSDIHLNEYTEPFLLREAVDEINRLRPDMVLLTGDYVSAEVLPKKMTMHAAGECASLLSQLKCPQRYAILGNHDCIAGEEEITDSLRQNGIPVLRNAYVPIERGRGRIWLAGLEDPLCGNPDPDRAIPASIRNQSGEPVILMCHAPDFVDELIAHPAGQAVSFMLSGHTHGGQVRIPMVGAFHLPPYGRKYIEGWFPFGNLQLYVNRGIGSVGVPFRFNCRPEITLFTLRPERANPGMIKS
ncbi:metallophosphoesterase [Acidobacteria bacterium AB60]|nr:metallophosphoesterase [Acidobacteria bacterium AB60]